MYHGMNEASRMVEKIYGGGLSIKLYHSTQCSLVRKKRHHTAAGALNARVKYSSLDSFLFYLKFVSYDSILMT